MTELLSFISSGGDDNATQRVFNSYYDAGNVLRIYNGNDNHIKIDVMIKFWD
ncbi:MAG TPA: hypothetical protein PKO16_00005 [Bacteroidia bacterium]|nr:hypothetical protein [Bacteroidia bacterium]